MPERQSVRFAYRRAFIPLAKVGCGIGCKYCYISKPNSIVEPLSQIAMERMLEDLAADIRFRNGPSGTLIAIGCDTELGINDDLVTSVVKALKFAAAHQLPVQLATKFELAERLRVELAITARTTVAPVVFTSITSVTRQEALEPGAPKVASRVKNFGHRPRSWLSYALFKPYLTETWRDRHELIDLLRDGRPDGVVVGVPYRRVSSDRTSVAEHPYAEGWAANEPQDSALRFAAKLAEAGLRVFLNTECVVDFHHHTGHGLTVKDHHPYLCVGCGACDARPERAVSDD